MHCRVEEEPSGEQLPEHLNMDRYCGPAGSRSVAALRRAQAREQAMLYLLALAQEKPVILTSVAALMKVTDATANINKALPAAAAP